MLRISGATIPENKRIEIALTYVYGIGLFSSKEILKQAGIDSSRRVSDLKTDELNKIREIVEKKYRTEGILRKEVMMNIKRLKEINSWRGSRHTKKLPTRGQRTKTNSRTVRGNVRKTVGSGKKPPPSPK
jgi:small subunit ribosomal protein S13